MLQQQAKEAHTNYMVFSMKMFQYSFKEASSSRSKNMLCLKKFLKSTRKGGQVYIIVPSTFFHYKAQRAGRTVSIDSSAEELGCLQHLWALLALRVGHVR